MSKQDNSDLSGYTCEDCGSDRVQKDDSSRNFVRWICLDCDSHTPLALDLMIKEANKPKPRKIKDSI